MKSKVKKLPAKIKERSLSESITSYLLLSIIIVGVSFYFVNKELLIGPIFILLGLINLIFLKIYKIEIKTIHPDLAFGFIDNGVLVFSAILGGSIAGVPGAILGGAAGNTLTDGVGGIFEGYVAQHQRKFEIDDTRTPLSTMLGKMAGCLFGAGIGLIIASFF